MAYKFQLVIAQIACEGIGTETLAHTRTRADEDVREDVVREFE